MSEQLIVFPIFFVYKQMLVPMIYSRSIKMWQGKCNITTIFSSSLLQPLLPLPTNTPQFFTHVMCWSASPVNLQHYI